MVIYMGCAVFVGPKLAPLPVGTPNSNPTRSALGIPLIVIITVVTTAPLTNPNYSYSFNNFTMNQIYLE
jgi:hypothetical protein